jgi:hypothetical protein
MTILGIGRFPEATNETIDLELISPFPLRAKSASSLFRFKKEQQPTAHQRGRDLLAEIHTDEQVLYAFLDPSSNCRIIVAVERGAQEQVSEMLGQIKQRLQGERLEIAIAAAEIAGRKF